MKLSTPQRTIAQKHYNWTKSALAWFHWKRPFGTPNVHPACESPRSSQSKSSSRSELKKKTTIYLDQILTLFFLKEKSSLHSLVNNWYIIDIIHSFNVNSALKAWFTSHPWQILFGRPEGCKMPCRFGGWFGIDSLKLEWIELITESL